MKNLVDKLYETHNLEDSELKLLLEADGSIDEYLFSLSDKRRQEIYGKDVYLRGLIEITNYCKNNCYYCGIRCGNTKLERYRLTKEDILDCCEQGYNLGYRTFVMQGGEDPFFTDDYMCEIISSIHTKYPDCAITLSLGEKEMESYQAYYNAGARRYLLRQETANEEHYRKLHNASMSSEHRKKCLFNLKEIGYQVGTGIMVGSPYQTTENIIEDLRFMQKLNPEMIGIGPFLTHPDTPFASEKNGSLELTLRLIAILRLLFPYALIPSTTALGTISPMGREKGLKAGANVVMPNLSPTRFRKLYSLYENKICTGEEAAECRQCLEKRVQTAGYQIVTAVGDCIRSDVKPSVK
ncbi:MAG: [FeFe] hydrogenase H-cluster radical SAM maturase HydE [Clostridia bacterium]|nr:[FeFe] hydrogenase H-cluster radical SAM maturase HydE [Clostridia bacterium]